MTRRAGSPARASLAVGLVAGLAACGGGGPVPGTDSGVAPPANEVPEMTITPPTNRGPEAVGSVPAQALTEGGAAHVVDVAERFRDPDGDPLSHSAASGDPEIVTVSMSGSMAKLTPVSIGEATVTVIASDGRAEAVQAFTVTVRRREAAPPAAGRPAPSPQPEARPAPPVEPEIIPPPAETKLTGIKVQRQADRGLSVRPVPQAARLKGVGLSWTPVAAGRIALLGDFGDEMWFIFHCNDHVGDVAITVRVDNPDGGKFEGSSTATCR